ncbi:L,D-transpeptidase [Candidatus Roizmanbacteria bacterium]|nr:L,D-transpeptidase [Candidatus Roizmanbacteria bacterium]
MKNIRYLVGAVFFFLATIVLLLVRNQILVRFSPQGTINPATIAEEYNPNERIAIYDSKPLTIPPDLHRILARKPITVPDTILGETSGGKRIEVDLANQRLYAFEGDKLIYNFLVSTGKWGKTPIGVFEIWTKIRSTKMSGGSKELHTYYYLPNVPFVMFFYNAEVPKWKGYGLHGTYWHNNFGHPMSHGCVNMKTEEVEQIYYWANPDLQGKSSINSTAENPGTKIIIYGVAPAS